MYTKEFIEQAIQNCETALRQKSQLITELFIETLKEPILPEIAAMVKDYQDAKKAFENAVNVYTEFLLGGKR